MSGLVKQYDQLEMYETSRGRYSIYINDARGHINLHKNLTLEEASREWNTLIEEGWYESLGGDEDLFSDDIHVRKVSRFTNDYIGRKVEEKPKKDPSMSDILEKLQRSSRYGNLRQRREDIPPMPDFKIRRME